MDIWISGTLGDFVPGLKDTAKSIKSQANGVFSKYNSAYLQLATKISTLQQMINATSGLLDKLDSSGLYILNLAPGSGNLASRIYNASNRPTGDFSAGIVVGVSDVDLEKVVSKYSNMMDVLTKPIQLP